MILVIPKESSVWEGRRGRPSIMRDMEFGVPAAPLNVVNPPFLSTSYADVPGLPKPGDMPRLSRAPYARDSRLD